MKKYDSDVLANCVLHFLGNLEQPLIPECTRNNMLDLIKTFHVDWEKQCCLGFSGITAKNAKRDELFALKKLEFDALVWQLPDARRHTLRMICQHLLNISNNEKAGMYVSDLAKIFGPILFGEPEGGVGSDTWIAIVDAMTTMIRIDHSASRASCSKE